MTYSANARKELDAQLAQLGKPHWLKTYPPIAGRTPRMSTILQRFPVPLSPDRNLQENKSSPSLLLAIIRSQGALAKGSLQSRMIRAEFSSGGDGNQCCLGNCKLSF